MANRTSIYKFLYSKFGDIWYPGYDYENMLSAETNFSGIYSFFGPGIINGWDISKLYDERADQILLLDGYNSNTLSEYGQKLSLLNLDFSVSCLVATTANISLTGIQTIDGVALVSGNIILVKNQSTSSQNGVYVVSSGTWSRHQSLNSTSDYSDNFIIYVSLGSTNQKTLWIGVSSSTNFTLGSSNLYFDNAFKQCIKVSVGTGILNKYAGKTEKSHYFRHTSINTYYIWAEPGISTLSDAICNITSPENVDEKYDTYSSAVYLAKVKYIPDSTYSSFIIASEIIYGERRNQINETAGEFQRQLGLSYLKHKHLGQINTPEKIDLENFVVLNGSNTDGTVSYDQTNIFLLRKQDGSLFSDTLSSYGTPIVKIDGLTLSINNYSFSEGSNSVRLFLNDSIISSSKIEVYLPISQDIILYATNDAQQLMTSSIVFNSYIKLSDGTIYQYTDTAGITTDLYKLFSWNEFSYNSAKVYLAEILVDPIHYTVNPYSGTILLKSSLPNYDDKTFQDVKVIVSQTKSEIQNSLSNRFINNVSASSISTGIISLNNLKINHYSDSRFKETMTFVPNKFLTTGIGKSYLNPQNTNSAIQYNDEITGFLKSSNIFSSLNFAYVSSSRGLFKLNINSNLAETLTSWHNDYGKVISLQDNILSYSNINYYKNTYALTSLGNVYYSDTNDNWNKLKLPRNLSGIATTISSFKVSTDKLANETYQTYQYALTSDNIYYSVISDNTAYQNWDWNIISNIKNTSGTAITNLFGLSGLEEISTERITYIAENVDEITVDRAVYVGAIGTTNKGLFSGDYSQLSQIFDETVKGVYWIKNGTYKNNIIWWNNYQAFITHTAKYYDVSTGKYWSLPFSQSTSSYTDAKCATISNISLTGAQIIDNVSVIAGDIVLVKNQTTKSQNGIYIAASGSWTRSTELDLVSEFVNWKTISITSGAINSNSTWYLDVDDSFTLGSSDISWEIYKFKIYQNSTPSGAATSSVISCAIERNITSFPDEYFIGHSNGVSRIQEASIGISTPYQELFWEPVYQQSVNALYSYDDFSNYGKLYAGTNNGIFVSSDLLWQDINVSSALGIDYKWKRANDTFENNEVNFTVFDKDYNQINDFSLNYPYQMVSTGSSYIPGNQWYYEKSFNTFSTDPWSASSSDNVRVMAYIDNKPSSIPFYSNPNEGTITFLQSVQKASIYNVKISIVKDFPVLIDAGTKPHSTTFRPLFKTKDPIALLAKANLNSETKIYINQRISDYSILELKNGNAFELLPIKSIDNSVFPIEVVLSSARTNSGTTFGISTEVYGIKDDLISGLEDDLYVAINNQTYNLSSGNNSNTQELARTIKSNIPTVYDFPSPVVSQDDKRGLKNTLLVDNFSSNSKFDTLNSSYKKRTENIPSYYDYESDPIEIKGIINLNRQGTNTRIITEKGVWKFDGDWILESKLDNAIDTNYISLNPNLDIIIGASNGVWKYTSDWTLQTSNLNQNCYLTGFWNGSLFEAYGKSDGLSIKVGSQSDFLKITKNNINGLFKATYNKNISGEVSEYESIHASGDDGYYVLGYDTQYDTFSSFLKPRKMFSTGNPSGVNKFYKSFQAYSIPSSTANNIYANPLFILTNDGILKVRNWKYSYPDDVNSSDFIVESRYLRNIQCFSYAIDTEAAIGTTPGKSKIYIGTNQGVYRSFDEGNTFERSDFIGNIPTCVFDLQIFSSTFNSITQNVLVACTNNGIWYTLDDGDCWYRTGENTSEGYSPVLFSSKPSNDIRFILNDSGTTGYLAQTFITASTANTISKVSAYLSIRDKDLLSNSAYNSSLANNTLTAYVYSVDTNSKPQTQLASSSPITSSSVRIGDFTSFNLSSALDIPGTGSTTLALVIKETTSSVPIFKWKKSTTSNPFSGLGYTSVNAVSWAGINTSYDLFFKTHYDVANTPTETIVPIGNYDNTEVNWDNGDGKAVISSDDGYLYLQPKFLISSVFDNSASMKASLGFTSGFNSIVSNIFSRTNQPYYDQFSYIDLWTFGDSVKHETGSGFTNSSISSLVNELNFEGSNSNLFDCLEYALIGQQPAAISGIADTDTISTVVSYLSDNNFLRLSDLKTRYKNESNKQLNLLPVSGSATGTTLTLSTDETNIFTWSTSDYPYSEVIRNGTSLLSGYTLLPSTGKISFSSSVGSTETIEIYLRKDWDGQDNTIYANSTVSNYVMERWAKTYKPLTFIASDLDNEYSLNLDILASEINNTWNNFGTKLVVFSANEKSNTGSFRNLVQNTDGLFFDASSSYWAGINTSLLHGGVNNLFSGYWNKAVEFDTAKFIKSVNTAYTVSTGQSVNSSCEVKFKYSEDKQNFSEWITFTSSYTLNKNITNLEFYVDMAEGWNNSTSSAILPYISQLYYTEVSPVVNYLFTTALASSEDIFEYILSTNYSDDKSFLTWGICKGDSTNWNDYEELITNKNGILVSRQRSYKYSNYLSYDKLSCVKSVNDNFTYFVYNNADKFTWLSSDTVQVYLNSSLVSSSFYTLDSINGTIKFRQEIISGNLVQFSLQREGSRYESYGEGTTTLDYKNYFAINGRWPEDSKVVVLVNNEIIRGGYKLDRYEGKVIFDSYKNSNDTITIFVLQSSSYRLGLKVESYSSTASSTYNFEFTNNTNPNLNLYAHYLNTDIPTLLTNSLSIKADENYASVGNTTQVNSSNRFYVDYVYASKNQEYKPRIRWYRTRTSGGGTTTVELDSTPNYRDRLVQKKADLNAANSYFNLNDLVYASLEPNDNFDYGITYTSDPVIIKSLNVPYVYDVQIKSSSIIFENKVSANSTLQAYYNFNGTADSSQVIWYEWTNGVSNKFAEGSILDGSFVLKNRVISFIVRPYNGQIYGIPIESQILNVV